ncbi:ketoacyl-ACP synthase III [Helicobacter muridarum]|uniref:3-oxoacyl-(Acyl carrier protein) synthase III n=1 Tax=Helicobacter muridarum TaxID=216 RepID=A0A099TXY8_9HELI|nr:3-oxoacyl-[acyl-carrier-protein] synthase III C-terminal domain-containing protein [Helicobacter muridarum]TLD98287.1 ketoacyl-ACP synthase III [Helicobacter muridarum]STQ85563.1 3-oxoacyl-(acyl carrier protein) synthase III [Helicobacter muridarum]
MNFTFYDKKITSILTILPKQKSYFDDEISNYNFPPKKSLVLKELMGYNAHNIANEGMLASDFIIEGFHRLFDDGVVTPDLIDVLIYVTQSPDYLVPQTSSIIQDKAGLKNDILCFDINQGCAGFLHGLFLAFSLLENPSITKVALANSDILSKKVSIRDRNSYPLVGDGGSITLIEKSHTKDKKPIYCYNKTFGEQALAINIPAGGFKLPSNNDTAKQIEDSDGNIRSLDNLIMQGASVFSFVQSQVPLMLDSLFKYANTTKDEIDYYMFHQPNKFMLQKLADKLEIQHSKMPNNIVENFGNGSGITIPLNICFNLTNILSTNDLKICFGGFGVGLTLSGIIMEVEKIPYLRVMEI